MCACVCVCVTHPTDSLVPQMWWPHVRVWEATGSLATLHIIGLRVLQDGVSSVAFCGEVSFPHSEQSNTKHSDA